MFKRTLEFKLARAPKKRDEDITEVNHSDVDYTSIFQGVAKGIALIAVSTIAADTLRQVAVNAAPKN